MNNSQQPPWWKFGHVWLVIAGPLVVVVASFITFYLAASSPDPVLRSEQAEVARGGGVKVMPGTLAPAQQARNHAATGEVPLPAEKR